MGFSFPQLFDWIERAGLHFVDFTFHHRQTYLKRRIIELNQLFLMNDFKDKENEYPSLEFIQGDIMVHDFYVSRIKQSEARLEDRDNIMFLYGRPMGLSQMLSKIPMYLS